jgi:hypothetical protein
MQQKIQSLEQERMIFLVFFHFYDVLPLYNIFALVASLLNVPPLFLTTLTSIVNSVQDQLRSANQLVQDKDLVILSQGRDIKEVISCLFRLFGWLLIKVASSFVDLSFFHYFLRSVDL